VIAADRACRAQSNRLRGMQLAALRSSMWGNALGGAVDTLLDRGSGDLAATRSDRCLLILARLRALDAYDRAWGGDERMPAPPREVLATSDR
jgi:hypothetical protein